PFASAPAMLTATPPTQINTLSLHDALPISHARKEGGSRHELAGAPHHRRIAQALVRDQECPLDSEPRAGRRQLGDATRARPHGGGVVPIRLENCAHVLTRKWKDFGRVRCS